MLDVLVEDIFADEEESVPEEVAKVEIELYSDFEDENSGDNNHGVGDELEQADGNGDEEEEQDDLEEDDFHQYL